MAANPPDETQPAERLGDARLGLRALFRTGQPAIADDAIAALLRRLDDIPYERFLRKN